MKIDKFKELHEAGGIRIAESFLVLKNVSEKEFEDWFPRDSFPTTKYSKARKEGTVDIKDIDYIFNTYHQIVETVHNHKFLGDQVFIKNKGFLDVSHFKENYLNWLKLFELVSAHHFEKEKLKGFKSFIVIDGNGETDVIDFNFSLYSPTKMEEFIKSISSPELLLSSCSTLDAHQGEKLSILKTSILKWFKNSDKSKLSILSASVELLDLFHLNYETYLKSFSFEDFIKDLEDDVGQFVSKIEEQVQGFYIQALAVPGTVILASAFRGAEKGVSLALIFSSVLALILVYRSLKTKIDFIKRVTKSTKQKLSIYNNRVNDVSNSFAKESISEKLQSSKEQINILKKASIREIKKVRDIIIGVFAIYVVAGVVFGSF